MARRSLKSRVRLPSGIEHSLDAALDRALSVQRPVVLGYVDRVRGKHPEASPTDVISRLERHYRGVVIGIGGASGAAAAVPGAGTAASVASGAAEIATFISATAMYVLALAEIHGVPVSDPQLRRALVLGVLVGEGGATAVAGATGETVHWAQVLGRTSAKENLTGINGRLAHLFLTRFATRQGALLAGRALPMGIGAGIGAAGNAALGRGIIASARTAFGPPPKRFPRGRVLDG